MALRRDNGFTLLEVMIVVTIMAVLAAMAIPSISDFIEKRKIINAAEAVYSQLQFARSQAISRSSRVYVKFGYSDGSGSDATTWLMGLHQHAPPDNDCDITQTESPGDASDDCYLVVDDGDGVIHDSAPGVVDDDDIVYYVISGANFNDVELDADGDSSTNGAPNQISFDPTRGTASNERVVLTYKNRYEMQVRVAVIGRVRICTPDNTGKQVPGYSVCND